MLLLLIHLLAVLARLLGPGGVRGLVAENVLIKQQLDTYLERKFGDEHTRYEASVRRWF